MSKQIKTKDLRKGKKLPKAPCYACGMHENITEWHHAVPLEHIANSETDHYDGFVNMLYCLCPNCHSYVHSIIKHRRGEKLDIAIRSMSENCEDAVCRKILTIVDFYSYNA